MKSAGRRAQVSVEYVLILAFTFAILIPGIYFFYQYASHSNSGIAIAQFEKAGQEMLATAERAAAQGEGTWMTLDVNLPESIENISIAANGDELVFTYRTSVGTSQAVFFPTLSLKASGVGDGSIFANGVHGGKLTLRFTVLAGGNVSIEERYA